MGGPRTPSTLAFHAEMVDERILNYFFRRQIYDKFTT